MSRTSGLGAQGSLASDPQSDSPAATPRPSGWKRWGWWGVLATTAATALVLLGQIVPRSNAAPPTETKEKVPVQPKPDDPFPQRKTKAPPLDGGVEWLNTAGPVELSKLKGKVVLIDFWTYCCINCIHVLPDLEKLEKKFPNELVVIGVHSAKFEGEKNSDNIREAIVRYGIQHPVVNDANMKIWRTYGVRSWPTRVLIDPEGNLIGELSGEGHLELFEDLIGKLVAYHEANGTLDRTPIHFELETYGKPTTPLRYPGKVLADPKGNRLFIADSSHHRLVVADLKTGDTLAVIGNGQAGLKDGDFASSEFNDPQGMAVDGDSLYVADRKNHALRKIDLTNKTVTTVAGNGDRGYERSGSGPAKTSVLASPWDLLLVGRDLYIAMAGTHQIWKLNLDNNQIGPFAGNGRENIVDGNRQSSEFAQPSGLATDGKSIYVADSEVSAVRKVGIDDNTVGTLVGSGLFNFGDIDGPKSKARLQHALGVAVDGDYVYVADTYNNKIKRIDLKTGDLSTYLGDGQQGDGQPHGSKLQFDEPAGISIADGKLYIADTNNHQISVVDLKTGAPSLFPLKGLTPPKEAEESAAMPTESVVKVDQPVSLNKGKPLAIKGAITVPAGFKLNTLAPMAYKIVGVKGADQVLLARGKISEIAADFAFETTPIDEADLTGITSLRIAVTFFPCLAGSEGVCKIDTAVWEVPVSSDAKSGSSETPVVLPAPPATAEK